VTEPKTEHLTDVTEPKTEHLTDVTELESWIPAWCDWA
jgi:hypothetical protein